MKLSTPQSVVSTIPAMLGFKPRESIVAVALDDDGSVIVTARVDLDTPAGWLAHIEKAATGAASFILVAWADDLIDARAAANWSAGSDLPILMRGVVVSSTFYQLTDDRYTDAISIQLAPSFDTHSELATIDKIRGEYRRDKATYNRVTASRESTPTPDDQTSSRHTRELCAWLAAGPLRPRDEATDTQIAQWSAAMETRHRDRITLGLLDTTDAATLVRLRWLARRATGTGHANICAVLALGELLVGSGLRARLALESASSSTLGSIVYKALADGVSPEKMRDYLHTIRDTPGPR
ncbi:MAG: DUF4192 family protein [Actinobacteria bacterium]|nr:DUF4192 family protein [Actinomycetota bacterium]